MKKESCALTTSVLFSFSFSASLSACESGPVEEMEEAVLSSDAEHPVSGADGPVLDDETKVVASFDSPDGRQLRFLEPEPGAIAIIQAGRLGSEPLVSRKMIESLLPEEIYEAVSGKEAPEALLAASLRSEELTTQEPQEPHDTGISGLAVTDANPTQSPASEKAKDIGLSTQALFDDTWFWNNIWYCQAGSPWTTDTCRGCSGQRDFDIYNIRYYSYAAIMNVGESSNLTGNFKVRRWATWSDPVSYTARPNQYVTYDFGSYTRRYDAKMYANGSNTTYTGCLVAQID